MIEIAEPPDIAACASCGSVLVWLYSFRTKRTFSVIPDETEHGTFRLHTCRHAQDYPTWKAVRQPDPPNSEYRQAYEAIGHKTEKINENEEN